MSTLFNQPSQVSTLLKQMHDLHDRAMAPVRDFQSRLPKIPVAKLPTILNKETDQ